MWPRHIASDLSRFHRRRIAEWHRGALSSFELLELFGVYTSYNAAERTRTIRVEFVPEDGALAAALLRGERPEWKQMLAQVASTTAVIRAKVVPNADSDEYGERLFLPVWRERELFEEHQERQREVTQVREQAPGDGMSAMWTQQVELTESSELSGQEVG
jgi:hypothetical protein